MKSFTKKSIRFFLFGVVFIFVITISGCKDVGKNDVAETDPASVLSEAEKETVIWKIYFSDYIEVWQEPLNQLLATKGVPYQVKIEAYHTIGDEPLENAADVLEKMKQDDDRADVIAVPASSYTTMADRELLLPLDDFLKSEQGMEIVKVLPTQDLARCRYNGVTYGVSAHLRTVGGIAYDKALLKKYDIDVSDLSSDIFENEAVLQKIKEGEGDKVIPYAYNDSILYSLGMWKVDPIECLAFTQTGQAVNIFETEELREKLFKIKDFKDKGLLGFASESEYGSFFATGKTVHREDTFESSFSYVDSAGQEITAEYIVVPDMKCPQIAPFWGDAQTAVASWSQNRENALDFLTRLYTDPDIANLILYGNEGREYIIEDNVATRLPSNLLWVFGEHYTNALIAYSQNDTAVDKMDFQARYYEQCESFIPDGFRFDPTSVAEEVDATNAVYYENLEERRLSSEVSNLFRLETEDIDASLSEINAELKEAGIDKIIEEFNRQLTEWRANYER
ncbi:MAG: extracellular solute-binding protein [Lachnospiraceae bacterium]|nr:extracellular solute-binding protein [Lachnospiraceae bacterium]